MKRRILIAALALVLAVGGIAALNIHTAQTATPIEMQVVDSIGDASAAQGLLVDHRIMLGTTLLWYTDYAPATGESDTNFYVTYRSIQQQPYYSWQDGETDETRLTCSAVDGENRNDPIVKELWAEAERSDASLPYVSRRIYPIDYYDTYPMYLAGSWGSGCLSADYSAELAFDKLRIPVGKYDFAELSLYISWHSDGATKVDSVGIRSFYMQNRFTPYCVNSGDHILVTAGFPADVEPQADWAPEGFGLWDMPVRAVQKAYAGGYYTSYLPTTAESRLVYPLDIETQRVALLEQSSDGNYILLVIVEDGRFVLHVLDSTDYHLVQQLDIDAAEKHESSITEYYQDDIANWIGDIDDPNSVEEDRPYRIKPIEGEQGFTLTADYREYSTVSMRQGDGFLVLLMGSRVALLTPDGEGYKGEFVCDVPVCDYIDTGDPAQNGYYFLNHDDWDKIQAESYETISSIVTADDDYSMAYNGRYLAMAAYVHDQDLLVSVFGKDGLQYAAYVCNGITTQLGRGDYSFSPVWADADLNEDGMVVPRPGLAWQN